MNDRKKRNSNYTGKQYFAFKMNELYKNQLSPFGQKVLQTLVEQYNTDRLRRSCSITVLPLKDDDSHNKKVLSFRDSNSYSPVNSYSAEKMLHSSQSLITQRVPKIIEDETENETESNVSHHMNSDINTKVSYKTKESSENETMAFKNVCRVLSVPDTFRASNDVGWNDMIDAELLRDVRVPNIENLWTKPEDNTVFDNNTKCKSVELVENSAQEIVTSKEVSKTNSKLAKGNQSKVTDENITKSKKSLNPKAKFKKERYTKTVKNWLNDVDANYTDVMTHQKINNQTAEKNLRTDMRNDKVMSKKKVVQAQLTNKDGVMKYGKPKTITDSNISSKDGAVINSKKETLTDTLKKKSKFLVPIKQQLPVKEILYDILTLDESNIDNYSELFSLDNKHEVLVVIVYRNGFCQLNSHYTEDVPDPEGLLLNTNDQFYYIDSTEGNNKLIVQKILERSTVVCYDGKIILIFLSKVFDCRPASIIDVKVGGALIDPDSRPETFTDLLKLISCVPQYTIATEHTLQKAAWYMVLLKDCTIKLKEALVDMSLWNIFVDIEMQLLPIIADMEKRGVCVDLEKLKSMEQVLSKRMKYVEEQCHKSAGRPFQINSPPQVRALLYDELRLDVDNHVTVKETVATGAKSTSEAALRSLMPLHPLPRLILEYRHLHKAYSTFLAGILQHVKDGVVYPTWIQIAAATGRIACSNPNLQAIPKGPFNLVMFPEPGDEEGGPPLWFRSVYVARPGRRLLAADFRQVECRIFAFAAADQSLLALLQQDEDIFRALAAQWLQKESGAVTSEERERTKRVVYASLYGAGARTLADMLALPYHQTLDILASFHRTFPSLKSFGERVVRAGVHAGGVVRSCGGRVRRLPNLHHDPAAARQALNHVVQGSAADLCKAATVVCVSRLRAACPPLDARLLLHVHDELVWDVHREHLDRAAAIIKSAMESSGEGCGLPLRLPVAVTAGRCWAHMAALHV